MLSMVYYPTLNAGVYFLKVVDSTGTSDKAHKHLFLLLIVRKLCVYKTQLLMVHVYILIPRK